MCKERYESRGKIASAFGLAVAYTFFSGVFAGCANPGPPRPPSLQLPTLVDDLTAERVGDRVLLSWTTPSRTTDGIDIKGTLTAAICRSTGTAANAKKSLAACDRVKQISVTPGASSAYEDLSQPLLDDPVTLLTYRVEIFNSANRSAGKSTSAAYAAAGAAPSPVASLTATASEAGAILKWNRPIGDYTFAVNLSRADLTSPASGASHKTTSPAVLPARRNKTARSGKTDPSAPNTVHLRAAAVAGSNASETGTVDTSAVMGQTYSYVAQQARLTTIDGHALELLSVPSPAVKLTMRDTFPPKPPAGLATIPGTTDAAAGTTATPYIDLSWEPNSEPDLAGYFVYRQLARPNGDLQGPLGKMTPLPIAAPAYRDVAVAPGQRYIYTVTAVDASGNESAPSAKAQEVAAAQNVGTPQ